MCGHEAGVGGDRGAVVAGRVRHLHPGQLADHGLVLEDGLQYSLAQLRLVGRVGGQELRPRDDCLDDRRHVVVVNPGPEEGELAPDIDVALGQLYQLALELELGGGRGQRQLAPQAHLLGNVREELRDRRDSDRL